MKIRDLAPGHAGRRVRVHVGDKQYEGTIRHIASSHHPGRDDRLAGQGTPPAARRRALLHLDTVAWDDINPDYEVELLD